MESAQRAGEKMWLMPSMPTTSTNPLEIADIKNTGGRWAEPSRRHVPQGVRR